MPTSNLNCGMQKQSTENATEKRHDNEGYNLDAVTHNLEGATPLPRTKCPQKQSTADELGQEKAYRFPSGC